MTISLTVSSIACEGCAEGVTKAIHNQDPNALVKVDVATKLVTVETTAAEIEIRNAIADAGHEVANWVSKLGQPQQKLAKMIWAQT